MSRALKPGEVVDRWRVELALGQGGMATVYRVRHTTLGTVHALKLLHGATETVRARLIEEGRVQAHLRHPNVVPVTDVLTVDGEPALLMDYVAGGTLSARVGQGPLPAAELERLFRGVVAGVSAAHARGVVHRDLKPANILLEPDDDGRLRPRVADFGLARALADEGTGGPERTKSGVPLGTPGYMAPEQVRDAARVDRRADVFALGATLFAMASGRPPFRGEDRFATFQAVVQGQRPDLRELRPDLPERLQAVVDACLQLRPDDRPEDGDAVLVLLDGRARPKAPLGAALTLAPDPSEAPPPPEPPPLPPRVRAAPSDSTRPAAPPAPPPAPPSAADAGPGPAARRATARALVVDDAGQGHVVELIVEAWPGPGGVRTPAPVDRDAEVAAQLAVAAALGPEAAAWTLRWAPRGTGFTIRGTSLGLALAAGAAAAVRGRPLPDGLALTGGLDLDGRVVPVHGVPAKLRAAAAAGLTRVGLPSEGVEGLPVPAGLALIPVPTWAALDAALFPAPRPGLGQRLRPALPAAALLLAPVAALLDLGSPADLWLRHALLRAAHGELVVDEVAVVGIPAQGDLKALRPRYPALLRALTDAGVTAIYWDLLLSAPGPDDAALAAAIRDTRGAGVGLVLPVALREGRAVPPGAPELAALGPFGVIEARQDAVFGQIRGIPSRLRTVDGEELWQLAVWAAAAHVGARSPPRLDGDELVIGPLRNPTWAEELWLRPTAAPPVLPWDAPQRFGELRGKVVVVGVVGSPADTHRTPDGVRSGAEVEAAAVQTLLRQAGTLRVPPYGDALAALIVGASTFAARRRGRWAPVGPAAAALAVVGALAAANLALAPSPLILALVVGLWAGRRR